MITTIQAQREVRLSDGHTTELILPEAVRIDNLRLNIGYNHSMLNKSVRIKAYGEFGHVYDYGEEELAAKDHYQLVSTTEERGEIKPWLVVRLTFEPCQPNSTPISVGIDSLNLP